MKRCTHCKTVYTYFTSTYGFSPTVNDEKYCPDCFKIIENALKSISVKFKKKFIATNDYTKEQIVDAQNTRLNNGIPVKRIRPGLYDVNTFSAQENVCEMMKDPKTNMMCYYSASWWPKNPDEVEITKEVWWDVINNCVAENQQG